MVAVLATSPLSLLLHSKGSSCLIIERGNV
jgi:hypothetical protein